MAPDLSRRLGRIGLIWWGSDVDFDAALALRNRITDEAIAAETFEAMPTWARNEVLMREALMARGTPPAPPGGRLSPL
jgi:hypothetical protein